MGLHIPDDEDLGHAESESDYLTKSLSPSKIDGNLVNTREFQPGDHILVRCGQSNWFRGRIKRLEKNGIRVWLIVSKTLVFVPLELVSCNLVGLEGHASGFDASFLLRVRCVRPSHLAHRYLYERLVIVPHKQNGEEAVKGCPDLKQLGSIEVSTKLMSCLNRGTFHPRRPTSARTDFSSEGFVPIALRETNPLFCGIVKDSGDKVANEDHLCAERTCCSPDGSEEYISAYVIAEDPTDENNMDQTRADLYKKFLARRTTLLQSSTYHDDNTPLRSRPTDAQPSGLSLETATSYLASKRDTLLFPEPVWIQKPAGNSSESTYSLEPCKNMDPSLDDILKNSSIPSKSRNHSDLYSMVELGNRLQAETRFSEWKAMISS